MGNCCGPFKRGQPAKAVVASQQCFVNCCGKLCPPDGCCESIRLNYKCGCGCECGPQTYNFGGLRFKKKRKGQMGIPTFSKKTLAANGFAFNGDGTIPVKSSSSSSVCECSEIEVNVTTTGCCLYLGPGGIEAVGSGSVNADHSTSGLSNCALAVKINGESGPVEVLDGDPIDVSLVASGDCKCCDDGKDCLTGVSASMWVQKSNKNGSTLVFDRETLMKKVRFAAERVRGRRRRP